MLGVQLPEVKRTVADEVLGHSPGIRQLLTSVPWPRVPPERDEVWKVTPRHGQPYLQRQVVARFGALDVREDVGRGQLLPPRFLEGEDEVACRQGSAVTPAQARLETEGVRPSVCRDPDVLGELRHHVELAVDLEQSAEEVLDEPRAEELIGIARRDRARP